MDEEIILRDSIEFYAIPNYPKYFISKCGKIISFRVCSDGRYLKLHLRSKVNYYYGAFSFGTNETKTHESLHRLLCLTFLPNPENKPCVNHINAIRTDNRLENLEWATYSENNKHAFVMGNQNPVRGNNSYAKQIIDLETGIVFDCIRDAADSFKINYSIFRIGLTHATRNANIRKRFAYV